MKKTFASISTILLLTTSYAQPLSKQQFADSVFQYICHKEILYPTIVMKQAIVETGGFQSPSLMAKNNLFGFRIQGKVLSFNSWQESVDYYKQWQDRKYTNPNEDYYTFLVRIKYATATNYTSKVKQANFSKTCNDFALFETDSCKINTYATPTSTKNETTTQHNTPKTYVVKQGDSLYTIAKKHKTSVAKLKQYNKLKSDLIKPGQKLIIP